jgi:GDPmannose 4,6-dehydratase
MRAIIFGITGQDGIYLNKLLISKGVNVIGVSRFNQDWQVGNVNDRLFVTQLIKNIKPDYIFHFSAKSTTQHNDLFDNHDSIASGTINILEAVYSYSPRTKIFLSGSGLQFVNNGQPIKETDNFISDSPYTLTRLYSVYAARYYRNLGIKVYIGYFFNHDSPFRAEHHVNQKIVKAAQRITNGASEILELGNLDVLKEFGFAGDIVRAVWTLIQQDGIFEVVIGTGTVYSIKDWVIECFKHSDKIWNDYVIEKKNFIPEYKVLVSDPSLIKTLGWEARISFNELAELMMKNK